LLFRPILHSSYATITPQTDRKGENVMLNVRLAFLRIGKGWSQAELAQRIGVSASAVGMYEQGRREPSLSLVVQLAQEFGVSTDYLLTGETQQGDPIAASEAPHITVRVENLIRYLLSTAE
jgi:transcriptional regulator with XRE-family HTH domain